MARPAGRVLALTQGFPRHPEDHHAPFVLDHARALAAALRHAREHDVLHGHWWIPSGLVAVVAGRLTGTASVVQQLHGTGPHAGGQNAPLLMTRQSDLPAVVRSHLEANKESISTLYVYGGSAAVSELVAGEAAAAAS